LIVDDESAVLASLQRMLQPHSADWEVRFSANAAEALASMATQPVDVVLADLRMPGMSGAQLLIEVAQRYPDTVRIAFSEPTDQELVLKCVNTTHQFLAKPCDAGTLGAALGRALNVDKLVCNDQLKSLVAQLRTIPSLPDVFHELQRQLALPDASVELVGQTIARDPAMTAKLLKLVNSAFFGLNRKVSSPADAALLLGLETIRMLVLWAHVFSADSSPPVPGFSLDTLSVHSMSVGRLARDIVAMERGNAKMRETAMTAGLLHDLGKLVIAVNYPDLMTETIALAQRDNLAFDVAERQIFGTDHAEVGAYLLGLWGLPLELVEVVGFHHRPSLCASETFSALTAVHVADVLQRESEPLHAVPAELDEDYLATLQLSGRVAEWRNELMVSGPGMKR
jgi:HD-like signal output (HDOD) protein/CheY-like chemotaxis protein